MLDSAAYDHVFAAPQRSSDRYFTALVRARGTSTSPGDTVEARLGLAISKRCSPDAVTRNRIKRVIRESFRHRRSQLPGIDVILLCRPAAAVADNAALRRSLEAHWDRISK